MREGVTKVGIGLLGQLKMLFEFDSVDEPALLQIILLWEGVGIFYYIKGLTRPALY